MICSSPMHRKWLLWPVGIGVFGVLLVAEQVIMNAAEFHPLHLGGLGAALFVSAQVCFNVAAAKLAGKVAAGIPLELPRWTPIKVQMLVVWAICFVVWLF